MMTSEFGEYSQLVRLPGPAKTKDMTIERKEHEVKRFRRRNNRPELHWTHDCLCVILLDS
jgi:hypothetical protein